MQIDRPCLLDFAATATLEVCNYIGVAHSTLELHQLNFVELDICMQQSVDQHNFELMLLC